MSTPSTPLDELEVSVRSFGVLQKLGVEKLADIARLSSEQILAVPSGTKRVVEELSQLLAECGLQLRE